MTVYNGSYVQQAPLTPPSSGMEGIMAGNLALSGGMAAASIVSSIFGYYTQETMQNAQADMAMAQYDHQDVMAQLSQTASDNQLGFQTAAQQIQVDGQKEMNAAIEGRKEEEDGLIVAKARLTEVKRTIKAGEIKNKAFTRRNRFNGNPSIVS